ncbi:hypothetical protein [Microbulbifer discodermiae]|uniref:hypothetical protein n=1 Tax=Microbulbifer sp. 2201CG32-9 TaxID=3232309 RepID=UPI00345BEA0C
MKRILICSLTAAMAAMTSVSTSAANDGVAGSSSSSGDFDITLNVPTQIIVKNFNNMLLDTTAATLGAPIVGTEDICVGGIGFASYSVNLSSQNGSSGGVGSDPFQLNGTSQNLPYTAAFIDNVANSTGTGADVNGDITGSFARNGNLDCQSDNARVFVTVDAAVWESANETSYSDTLTVTVTAL